MRCRVTHENGDYKKHGSESCTEMMLASAVEVQVPTPANNDHQLLDQLPVSVD